MRSDMSRVLAEKPRNSSYGKDRHKESVKTYSTLPYGDYEYSDTPNCDGMQDWLGRADRKELDWRSSPFKRFLLKNVNRKWDDVWSEICESTKRDLGHVFRQRIKEYFVDFEVFECLDGSIRNQYGLDISRCRDRFYVDKSGVLRLATVGSTKHRPVKPTPKIIKLDKQEYFQHNSIWYRVEMQDVEPCKYRPWTGSYKLPSVPLNDRFIPTDAFGQGGCFLCNLRGLHDFYGRFALCVKKQQANSKECKKLTQLLSKDE